MYVVMIAGNVTAGSQRIPAKDTQESNTALAFMTKTPFEKTRSTTSASDEEAKLPIDIGAEPYACRNFLQFTTLSYVSSEPVKRVF